MQLPEGISEEEFVKTLDNVVRRVAHKFLFPGHSKEDLMQQGRVFAIQAMNKGKYNEAKGNLESFLYTHVHNRLHNFKRDNYERTDLPCLKCPLKAYDPHRLNSANGCIAYDDMQCCELFWEWRKRNDRKKNLCGNKPSDDISVAANSLSNSMGDEPNETPDLGNALYAKTVIETIDKNISLELRRDWIRMKNGNKITNVAKEKLLGAIHEILGLDKNEESEFD